MKIQGRNCTLTVARDGDYYPLPYSEETVREASKGYVLPGVIGRRNREKTVITHKEIEGCFTTRLDVNVVQCLFLLFFYYEDTFDLYADRVFEKIIYKNVKCRGFELRGENREALKHIWHKFDAVIIIVCLILGAIYIYHHVKKLKNS